jgi:hypothetical protein
MRTLALVAALFAVAPAQAVDVFVVDAKGIELAPGKVLDGSKPLVLAVGQKVTLVTADGRTLKLKGPSEAPPSPEAEAAQADVAKALKGLVATRVADTSSAGVIRSGGEQPAVPTPWLVEIRHAGTRCALDGDPLVLWRGPGPATEVELEIGPTDRSWRAHAVWPAGSDRLQLPPSLPLRGGHAYVVTLDHVPVTITVHTLPNSVGSDAARAAWLLDTGCTGQAAALISGGS